jgi:hypothetical protein
MKLAHIPTFRRNISPPSSRSKRKKSKKAAERDGKLRPYIPPKGRVLSERNSVTAQKVLQILYVTLYTVVVIYHYGGGIFKMDAAGSSETSVNIYQITHLRRQ